jgi:hypothetical protein
VEPHNPRHRRGVWGYDSMVTDGGQTIICPNCGADQLGSARFCEECGAPLRQAAHRVAYAGGTLPSGVTHPPTVPASQASQRGAFCAKCGAKLEPDSVFCHMCGTRVGPGRASPPQPSIAPSKSVPHGTPSVILAVGDRKVRVRFPTGTSAVVLGRTDPVREQYPDVDLTLFGGAELGVSRLHARLSYEGGRFYLEDLQSTNRTYIGETELAPREPRVLSSGQVIRLGRLEMLFLLGS